MPWWSDWLELTKLSSKLNRADNMGNCHGTEFQCGITARCGRSPLHTLPSHTENPNRHLAPVYMFGDNLMLCQKYHRLSSVHSWVRVAQMSCWLVSQHTIASEKCVPSPTGLQSNITIGPSRLSMMLTQEYVVEANNPSSYLFSATPRFSTTDSGSLL